MFSFEANVEIRLEHRNTAAVILQYKMSVLLTNRILLNVLCFKLKYPIPADENR